MDKNEKLENGVWVKKLDMENEGVHFFARSKANQIQCLEKFIKESFESYNNM